MANRKNTPIKAPNPFGEVSRDAGTQPPDVPAPTTEEFRPVTGFVVPGQKREEPRRAHGHVLTEYGWTKERESNG